MNACNLSGISSQFLWRWHGVDIGILARELKSVCLSAMGMHPPLSSPQHRVVLGIQLRRHCIVTLSVPVAVAAQVFRHCPQKQQPLNLLAETAARRAVYDEVKSFSENDQNVGHGNGRPNCVCCNPVCNVLTIGFQILRYYIYPPEFVIGATPTCSSADMVVYECSVHLLLHCNENLMLIKLSGNRLIILRSKGHSRMDFQQTAI
ncbi:hypothetical protein M514_03721 [Trichuris suis]|uniref:Uncharacterized protein n=1 Tax=Trichuris suis TaxID=68888 RepID=A0A085NGV7_9BILA|nr:hypothetical protein M513_03721 [Trichuris suis]KFD68703.1 hypothetical protein M514_03721 [Trichuris suis]